MRIVSLQPAFTEFICTIGLDQALVGVSHRCDFPPQVKKLPVLTKPLVESAAQKAIDSVERALSLDEVDFAALAALTPDIIVTRDLQHVSGLTRAAVAANVSALAGRQIQILSYDPRTLQQVVEYFSELATALDVAKAGIELASKFSAQCKDWVANFYPRMRGKKVSFLTGTAPLILGGLWIPDMIVQTGAVSQYAKVGQNHRKVEWNEIVAFAPDVIIIAPGGLSVVSSMKRLAYFEALEGWEDLPAVKRGEVIFTDGAYHFSRPGPGLLESMGVLVSAISGLESGYITPRDSFHRLRWVEMNRGKLP